MEYVDAGWNHCGLCCTPSIHPNLYCQEHGSGRLGAVGVLCKLMSRTLINSHLMVFQFMNAGFAACCHLAANAGMGRHMAALEPPEIIETLKLTTIAQSVGISVTGFAKLALGLFLLRIVIVPWHRLAIWIPMLIVGAGCVLVVVCLWLQKTPVEAVYNPFIPAKTNLDQTALSLVYSCKFDAAH